MVAPSEMMPMRRVAGYHDIRMDGMADLVCRARGASVLDIGCNRGMVGLEFANNGASVVHGCDIYEPGIKTAREMFADSRSIDSKFEVVDLTKPKAMFAAFGDGQYDIVLMLATYHKLKREMPEDAMTELMADLGNRALKYFAWRATSRDVEANKAERKKIDNQLNAAGMRQIHYSEISEELGMAAIWKRD